MFAEVPSYGSSLDLALPKVLLSLTDFPSLPKSTRPDLVTMAGRLAPGISRGCPFAAGQLSTRLEP